MQQTRRALLASTGVALLSGCLSTDGNGGDGGDGAGEGDGSTPTPEPTPEPTTVVDRTTTILEDEYETWDVSLSEESEVAVGFTVRDGPAVDVVFTTQSEFEQFQAGNRFRTNPDLSFLNSAGDQSQTSVSAGSYVLLVDNTEGIDASPPQNFDEDPAEVELLCQHIGTE